MKKTVCAAVIMLAGAAHAVELQLPTTARQMITRDTVQDRYLAPVAPFADGQLPTLLLEGSVARSAWRIDQAGLTPLQVLTPLGAQLRNAGFRIVLDCAAKACGGYDFRFGAEVLPAPNMYVNIRNFHVLTALRGPDGSEAVNIIASASSGATFVQIIQAGSAASTTVEAVADVPNVPQLDGSIGDILLRNGHVVLEGLDFQSGTSELGNGPFDALAGLVQVLRDQPDLRVALVGHTDNVGSLDGNIALSRSRASAVRARLVKQYGVAAGRLDAEGMGYLAPHTTNQTKAGREANRRVEAVVLEN